jgi:hypothetical protein
VLGKGVLTSRSSSSKGGFTVPGQPPLLDFPPITTKNLGNTTDLGAIGGYYGTERVIW